MSATQVKQVPWWGDRLIDWMIANPEKRLKDAAIEFNKSISWLSILKNSDVFKQRFAERSAEVSLLVNENVFGRLTATTELALDALNEKLESQRSLMPTEELTKIAEMGLEKLGYGAKAPPLPAPTSQTNIQNNTIIVSKDALAEARRRVMEASGVVVNQTAIEAPVTLEPVE